MDYLFLGFLLLSFTAFALPFFAISILVVWELEFKIHPQLKLYLRQNTKIDTSLKLWLPILSIILIFTIITILLNIYYYFRSIYYWSDLSFIERFKYPAYYLLIVLSVITYSELTYRIFRKIYKPNLKIRRLIYLQSFAILASFNFINFLIGRLFS